MTGTPAALAADSEAFKSYAIKIGQQWKARIASDTASSLAQLCLERALLEPSKAAFLSTGKRLRPLMASWAWRSLKGDWNATSALPQPIFAIGTAVEMLHAASLVVDDIQDGSIQRRGLPSVHTLHGEAVAINAANWLYFEALEMFAQLEKTQQRQTLLYDAIKMLSHCHMGQALDLSTKNAGVIERMLSSDPSLATELYEETARMKTAELMGFAVSAVVRTSVAQVENGQRIETADARATALAALAIRVGQLYQKADDLRNVSAALSGNKAGEDFDSLRNFVAIQLLQKIDPIERADLPKIHSKGELPNWLLKHKSFCNVVLECLGSVSNDMAAASTTARGISLESEAYLNSFILTAVAHITAQVRKEIGLRQ
jgi:octaprenyl-diphosphate synthase